MFSESVGDAANIFLGSAAMRLENDPFDNPAEDTSGDFRDELTGGQKASGGVNDMDSTTRSKIGELYMTPRDGCHSLSSPESVEDATSPQHPNFTCIRGDTDVACTLQFDCWPTRHSTIGIGNPERFGNASTK